MNKEKAKEWFLKNMETHSDWTGTYIEYKQKCDSVEKVFQCFIEFMES